MKVNIEFDSEDITNPEKRDEILQALCEMFSQVKNWNDTFHGTINYDNWLRNKIKRDDLSDTEDLVYTDCRKNLLEFIGDFI